MIVLPDQGRARILSHARETYPEECCGLLTGRAVTGDAVRVRRVVPAPNVSEARRGDRFEVDPQVRFDLMRALDGSDETIVGHYHSHPGGAPAPSDTDRALAFEPDMVWLICAATADGAGPLRAWRIADVDGPARAVPLFQGGALLDSPVGTTP